MSTPPPVDRRLAAFWFADIVGFTPLSARDEEAALGAVHALQSAARQEVGRAGGRVVKFLGDAVLAEFPSGDAALRSAIGLRQALHGRVPLHIGVHLGEVTAQHGDIYGDGVNTASRLQSHATTGQILVSEDVYRHVRTNPAYRFAPVGPLSLKGVAAPLSAYLVEPAERPGVSAGAGSDHPASLVQVRAPAPPAAPPAAPPLRPPRRLIVAPFRLLRPDEDTQFLSFSLADAVSFGLSNLQAIVVRSSHLAGSAAAEGVVDPRWVARQADVDLVVTGTLLRVGDRLQVTAELSEGGDGTRLGSFRAQAGLGDLFELQDEMTRRIVEALRLPLTSRERALMTHDVPASASAYQLFLKAKEAAHRMVDWPTARDLYEAALAEDPLYAPAWAELGRCHRLLAKYDAAGVSRQHGFARAEAAFARALELNPELDLAHAYSAQHEVEVGRAGAAVLRLRRRLESRPTGVDLLAGLVQGLRYAGLLEESAAVDAAARALDPSARTSVAFTFFLLGDYERAARAGTENDAYVRALAQLVLGREAEARELLGVFKEQIGLLYRPFLEPLQLLLEEEVEEALRRGLATYREFPDAEGRYFFARLLAWKNREAEALELLEGLGPGWCAFAPPGADPWLSGLDRSPAYARLLREADARRGAFRELYRAAGG